MSITTVIFIALVTVCILAICYTMKDLSKHGINVQGGLQTADNTLNIADTIADSLKEVMPQNRAIDIVDKIIDYAHTGVQAAEQMAKSGQITPTERKAQANAYIVNALKTAGIEITPEIQTAIDGAVECSVVALPKSNIVKPTVTK